MRAGLPSPGHLVRQIDWPLAALLVAALAFRLLPVLDYNSGVPNSARSLVGDEPGYANMARELLDGKGFLWPARVPLYPTFLAVVFALGGESYHRLRIVQALLGVTTVWLTYLLGRRLLGRTAGAIGAGLAAVSFPLCDQARVVLSENLFTPMMLVLAWVTLDAVEKPSLRRAALLGFAIGISDLIRPTLLLYPAFLLLGLPRLLDRTTAWRIGLAAAAAAFLTVLPWTVHNYVRHGAVLPLATSHAAVWQASPEYARTVAEIGYMRVWKEVLYGPGWQARDPGSVAGDRYWTARGLRSIQEAPLEYAAISVKRVATFWIGDPGNDWLDGPPFSYKQLRDGGWLPSQAIRLMAARFLPILGLVAAIVLWRERRKLGTVYLLLVFATLFHAVTIAVVRLSEPFQPFVCIIVAGAFDRLTAPRSSAVSANHE